MDREIWKQFGKLSPDNRNKIVSFIKEDNSEKLSNLQIIQQIIDMGKNKWEDILSR